MHKILKSILLSCLFLIKPVFADNLSYSIIVDAGSSGTRLHLYKHESEGPTYKITEEFSEDTKPGLSSYASDPEQAGPSLKKLFDDAVIEMQKRNIKPSQVTTDIFATAGMRLLPQDQQMAIYANIRSYLMDHYTFAIDHVETISGKMEGLYDWLDVNYLENNFVHGKQTLGAIDMGGASTQIAYATQDTSKPDDEIDFQYNNQHYTVFSKSFLGLGQDASRSAVLKQSELGQSCFPTGYFTNAGKVNTYNFNQCGNAYSQLIDTYHIPSSLPPFNQTTFAMFSGTYYAYHFFGVEDNTQGSLEARVNTICQMTWDQMKQKYADSNIPEKILSAYCANGTYLDHLFYDTYHLNADQMWVTNKVHNGQSIDWALGALLYQLTQN